MEYNKTHFEQKPYGRYIVLVQLKTKNGQRCSVYSIAPKFAICGSKGICVKNNKARLRAAPFKESDYRVLQKA